MAVRTAVSISTRAYRHVSSILLLLLLPHLLSKKCFLLSTNWIQPSRSRSGSCSIAAEKSSSVFDIQVSARLVVLQNIWCLLLFRFTADLTKLFPPLGDHGNMTPNSHLINSWKVFLLSYWDQSRYSTWFLSESFMPDAKDDWLVKGDLLHQQKITTLVQSQKCRFQLNPPRMRIATERHHHALWTYLSSSRSFPPFIRLIFVSQKHP